MIKGKRFHRFILYIAFIPLLTACEGLDGCMTCQLNTYEDNNLIIEGAETEYCGAELAVIRATADEVDPPYTYKWECR